MKTRHTKETGVEIRYVVDHWRHVATRDGHNDAVVGPIYKTKAEILADHDRYMRDSWGCE